MTLDDVLSALQADFPDASIEIQSGEAGEPWLKVPPEHNEKVLRFLYDRFGLTYLACLGGIDYAEHLCVFYRLRNLETKFELTVKAFMPRDKAEIRTVTTLFAIADWFERETYDLLGIHFIDHPDLRRIMLPDDWEGHPLRKDYKEPTQYHGISTHRPEPLDLLSPGAGTGKTTDKLKRVNTAKTNPSGQKSTPTKEDTHGKADS